VGHLERVAEEPPFELEEWPELALRFGQPVSYTGDPEDRVDRARAGAAITERIAGLVASLQPLFQTIVALGVLFGVETELGPLEHEGVRLRGGLRGNELGRVQRVDTYGTQRRTIRHVLGAHAGGGRSA